MDAISLQSGSSDPIILAMGVGVVLFLLIAATSSSSSSSSSNSQSYEDYVERQISKTNGHRNLPDDEYQFLLEYGIKLCKDGYRLDPEPRQLKLTYSGTPVALFRITESESLNIVARNNGQWVDVEPADGQYNESELLRKERRLNQLLPE